MGDTKEQKMYAIIDSITSGNYTVSYTSKTKLPNGYDVQFIEWTTDEPDSKVDTTKSTPSFQIRKISGKPIKTTTLFLIKDGEYVGHASAKILNGNLASLDMSGLRNIPLPDDLDYLRNVALGKKDVALLVDENYRGLGKGKELMNMMLDYLDTQGVKDVSVASISDEIAMATYTGTGAEKIDDQTAIYRNIREIINNRQIQQGRQASRELPKEMIFDKDLTEAQVELLKQAWEEFNKLRENGSQNKNVKKDTNGKVTLEKGTLLHGTFFDIDTLRKIKESGILASEFFGQYEDGETFYCADFYRVQEEMGMQEYINWCKQKDVTGRVQTPKIETSRLPVINQNEIAFIINPNNTELQKLLDNDVYRDNEKFETMKDIVYFNGIDSPRLYGSKERLSAVLGGIPSNYISGIWVGDKVRDNDKDMAELISIFGDCYIVDGHGDIIYEPEIDKNRNVRDNRQRQQSNEAKSITPLAKRVYDEVAEQGITGITNLFAIGDTLAKKLNFNPGNEYLKRMLIAQMDLDGMLMTHKYFNTGFDAIPQFRKEAEQIRRYTETDSILQFDDKTMDALFGNALGITSEEEYEEWKEFAYSNRYKGKNIDILYLEEEFKHDYEHEQNPIKKFIQSFRYRRLFRQDALEDSYTKKVREMLREGIATNPDNTFAAHQECSNMLQRGVAEYESLQGLESIAKITLTSLQQTQDAPIDIANACRNFRTEMQNSHLPRMGVDYRQRQVTLGSETGIRKGPVVQTIPFEEVPNAIGSLQQEYEDLYANAQSQEDYIRGAAKIYADFIYVQPYEDGNKRTATCLLNSILLSKGILPPPISLVNNEQMVEAFNKAKDKDYTMLQDIIVSKHRKLQATFGESSSPELSKAEVVRDTTEEPEK